MWLLPSLNRPDRCQEVLDSMMACNVSTSGIVLVNGSLRADEYRDLHLPDKWHSIFLDENVGVCGAMNRVFATFPSEPWYGLVCDDELVFTEGFDNILVEAAGAWAFSHGNDSWKSSYRLWTYVVCGGELLRAIGSWTLPGLFHWYHDDFQEQIAREFNLKRWCQNVQTQHKHHETGRAQFDYTYEVGQSRANQDTLRFEQWKRDEWPALRDRLKPLIHCT